MAHTVCRKYTDTLLPLHLVSVSRNTCITQLCYLQQYTAIDGFTASVIPSEFAFLPRLDTAETQR